MRVLENLFIKIFSLIILVLSVLTILVGFGIVDNNIFSNISRILYRNEIITKITFITCLIFIVISLKILITKTGKPKNGKEGIILENTSGKLIISKESLDNMISNAAKDIPGAESITSKTYLDLDQNLKVYVTVTVSSDISIKDLSTRLQSKIKSSIKQTADLDVSEVNVKIKNIINKKSKKERNIQKEVEVNTPEILTTNEIQEINEEEFENEVNNEE